MFKLLPSVAYLRVRKQVFIGYSMPLAGWIGEHLINYEKLPRPIFIDRAMTKLGFSFSGEQEDEDRVTRFFTRRNVSAVVSWDTERDEMFVQLLPLRSRISKGLTVRAGYIEFYDRYVVSIEPSGRLPQGVRGVGINALILEDFQPVELPYWGMLYEDWENDLNILVMRDEVFEKLFREEYRCPVCFAPLNDEGGVLRCTRCGFIYTPESELKRVLDTVALGVEGFAF
ncbi:MAG: hypothetical protein GXO14_04880 [Thermococci archaeon]|nr:hypothetical protein [Thermococci archaeon]